MTFWIAAVDRGEMAPEWEEVTSSHFKSAVTTALARFGKADWTIAAHEKGAFDDWGPGEELAYHAEEYPETLFVRTLGLRYLQGGTISELVCERALEDAAAEWAARDNHYPLRSAGVFRGCLYPGELVNFAHFEDTSERNDVTASVQFAIGAEVFRVWIAPLRPFDRSTEIREQEAKAFQVAEHDVSDSTDEDIDDALENANAWASDISFETDSLAQLNDYFTRIYNAQAAAVRQRGAAAGAQAASPERQLGNAVAKLPPYNGWKIEYHADAGIYEAHHPDSDIHLQWTIDEPERGQIGIAAMEADGVLEDGRVAFATIGRDADKLLAAVKTWLDRYQPYTHVDATAARFAQLETDRGPRRSATAPDVDDTAERFKLLELNGGGRRKNPAGKTFKLQKVTAKVTRDIAPEGVKPGVLTSPELLVADTLAPYLEDRAHESFVIVYVNIRNKIVGYTEFTMGSTSGVQVDPAGIMRDALGMGAAGFVTAHNHPSGDPTPSSDDVALWARLRDIGALMGIPVIDNLVVGSNGRYYSQSQDSTGRVTVRKKNPAYPAAGELQQQTIAKLTGNPLEVRSRDGGLEGVFARPDDAEFYADELRRIGAQGVTVVKKPRSSVLGRGSRQRSDR